MIGIIGAMQSEVMLLKDTMSELTCNSFAGIDFYTGRIYDKRVVLAKSGMGKVNAAICAQIMIDTFSADVLINTGIAGGIHLDLHVGDLVIGKDAVEHDYDLSPVGYAKGYVDMEGYPHTEPVYFKAPEGLVNLIYEAASELMDKGKIHIGTIASGDVFVNRKELKDELRERYNAYAAEMEGAAIMHTAVKNGVDAVVIRCISDLADENAHESVANFEQIMADRSAKMLMEAIRNYA